jgi:hypothetical protein
MSTARVKKPTTTGRYTVNINRMAPPSSRRKFLREKRLDPENCFMVISFHSTMD